MSQEEKKGGLKRRDFLKLIGVTGGTAAVASSCSEPVEQIIPYVIPPENVIPGLPTFYSSTCRECSAGCSIVVKTREGRAIKVEGNPNSPVNKGKTCAAGQASLQGLYNPDRVRSPLRYNEETGRLEPVGWNDAIKIFTEKIAALKSEGKGNRIAYLSNDISGTYGSLVNEWLEALGGGKRYTYETFAHEPIKKANELTFGIPEIPSYHIDKADYLLSFGADYLETWLSPTTNSSGFARLKDVDHGKTGKIVHVEPRSSMTAANADKWIDIKPGTEQFLALGIANVIINRGWSKVDAGPVASKVSKYTPESVSGLTEVKEEVILKIARDFTSSDSLAIGGGAAVSASNATETQVAVNILNYLAGNIGRSVDFSDTLSITNANSYEEIKSLCEDMRAGNIDLLVVHNTNPVHTLPSSLNVEEAIKNVDYVVSMSPFTDETSELAQLILPESTSFESWGDFQPKKSVISIMQPSMTQVFNTKQAGDILISSTKINEELKDTFKEADYLEYLQNSWKKVAEYVEPRMRFDDFWKKVLVEGVVTVEQPPVDVSISSSINSVEFSAPEFNGEGEYFFMAYPSYRFLDGRGANKPWLQELPDALTTSVWDSWVEIHPDTASKMGVRTGSFVKLETAQGSFETQVFVYEGIRPDTVAVPLGQGHKSYGRYAKDRGVNPVDILPDATDALSGGFAWLSSKVSVTKTGNEDLLVRTQYSLDQDDRKIAQAVTLEELSHHGEDDHGSHGEHPDFYPEKEYAKYRWGMSIDLNKCSGCGACVTACYAENNVPFVGKAEVAKRREMSWLRIERYFEKNKDGSLDTRFIPMLCQQCGNAPCEPVCPVYATYHNPEGLNGMVYNRCVGTRYCANNCIYKVRRFNWFQFKLPEPLNWQLNPDVTVRSKGVMEKCTFCIQRINYAKDKAKDENRLVKDGEFKTACEQACASEAIVFGNLVDEKSRVSKMSHDKRGYHVLEEINAKPGITYLKKVKQENV